jgi:DHA1 family arabinose polymer transporter-like MFS transporter
MAMAVTLLGIYALSSNAVISLILTFIAGALSMAIAAPIQILMIRTAKGAEMLGAAVTQAAFNIGNALGAFFGGLPIAAGLGFTYPALAGAVMAVIGLLFAYVLLRKQSNSKLDIALTSLINNP